MFVRTAVQCGMFGFFVVWSAAFAFPNEFAKVDKLFAEWNRNDAAGCAVGIVRDAKLIHAKGFGSANLEYEVANSPQTVFEIASFSKGFTTACIAILLDEGKISLDDELHKWVPEMHQFDSPVRVRHMLRCETGLWAQFHIMPLAGWDNVPVHATYYSAELATSYRFKVEENSLWLRVNNRRWERLDPTIQDQFMPHIRTSHDVRVFTFRRNGKGKITGMTASFWRIRGVDFVKRQ